MIALCAAILIGALGSAARYAQGNGHAGPGRWSLFLICAIAAWYGLQPQNLLDIALAWACAAFATLNRNSAITFLHR